VKCGGPRGRGKGREKQEKTVSVTVLSIPAEKRPEKVNSSNSYPPMAAIPASTPAEKRPEKAYGVQCRGSDKGKECGTPHKARDSVLRDKKQHLPRASEFLEPKKELQYRVKDVGA
jgi:hypothetical protein